MNHNLWCRGCQVHTPKVVNLDSIKILDHINPRDKWARRKDIVLPTVDNSMCEILNKSREEGKSLGVFKPCNVNFVYEQARSKDLAARIACYAQLRLFHKQKEPIETIPFDFRYKFSCCNEPSCPGHNYSIIDWEIGESYRGWRRKYESQDVLLKKIEERWFIHICSSKNDVYFFVGNMKRRRDIFMILGVFYPPKSVR